MRLETAPVAQLGQRVDLGQVPGFALAGALLGDVTDHPDRAADLPVLITQPGTGEVDRQQVRADRQQQVRMQVDRIAVRVEQHGHIQR